MDLVYEIFLALIPVFVVCAPLALGEYLFKKHFMNSLIRSKGKRVAQTDKLIYSIYFAPLLGACMALVLAPFSRAQSTFDLVAIVFVFLMIGAMAICEWAFRQQIQWDGDGVTRSGVFTSRHIVWNEITEASLVTGNVYFRAGRKKIAVEFDPVGARGLLRYARLKLRPRRHQLVVWRT